MEGGFVDVKHWSQIGDSDWSGVYPWKKYFTPEEIACRGSGRIRVESDVMDALYVLRLKYGKPMHILSGCRSSAYNDEIYKRQGLESRASFHVYDNDYDRGQKGCMAFDVAALDGRDRGELFSLAWGLGWSIGWNSARGFLHLDLRTKIGWRQTTFGY